MFFFVFFAFEIERGRREEVRESLSFKGRGGRVRAQELSTRDTFFSSYFPKALRERDPLSRDACAFFATLSLPLSLHGCVI